MAIITEYMPIPKQYECPYWERNLRNGDVALAGTDSLVVRNDSNYTPDNKPNIWSIEAVQFNVNTDANAGDRYPYFYVYTEYGFFIGRWTFGPVAASQTASRHGLFPISHNSTAYPAVTWCGIHPKSLMLIGAGYINASLSGGKAGDTWQLGVRMRYMNYELGMVEPAGGSPAPPTPPPPTSTFPDPKFN